MPGIPLDVDLRTIVLYKNKAIPENKKRRNVLA